VELLPLRTVLPPPGALFSKGDTIMSRRRSKILNKEVYPYSSSVHSAEDVVPGSSSLDLLGVCQRVVAQRQAECYHGFTVDLLNASAFLQVFNDLDSKCLKAKLLCLPPADAFHLAWSVIGSITGCSALSEVCPV
jgi:hypothetical protein